MPCSINTTPAKRVVFCGSNTRKNFYKSGIFNFLKNGYASISQRPPLLQLIDTWELGLELTLLCSEGLGQKFWSYPDMRLKDGCCVYTA